MASLYIRNNTTAGVSIVGDAGKPAIFISPTGGINSQLVDMYQVFGNILLCDTLHDFIDAGTVTCKYGSSTGRTLTASDVLSYKDGSPFDTNEDGIADYTKNRIRVYVEDVNLKDATTEYTVTLPGNGTGRFMPQHYFFHCTAATALNADGTINVATTTGGTDLLNAQALTGLNLLNEVFRVDVAVTAAASIADNVTLYIKIASADTGTSGTMNVHVEGIML